MYVKSVYRGRTCKHLLCTVDRDCVFSQNNNALATATLCTKI